MNNLIKTALIVAVVALGTVGVAYAAYIMTSNHVTGTPGTQATLTLTSSTASPISGVAFQLTAHVSDNTPGIPVTLYNNAVQIGVPVSTDTNGDAVFTVSVTAAYDFHATGQHP